MKLLSYVQLFVTSWTVAYKAPPSMGFSRQEYWSGLLFPSSAKGKVHSQQAYLKKQEKDQINNLTLYLKQLEKEMKNPRVGRKKEIIKIRAGNKRERNKGDYSKNQQN